MNLRTIHTPLTSAAVNLWKNPPHQASCHRGVCLL